MKSTRLPRAALAAPLLLFLAGPARAQSAERPQLTLTMSVGWITGGALWRLPRQEAAVAGGALDTVALERRFRTGIVVGAGATLFRSPHFGYTAELVFYGVSTESVCTPPAAWAPDPLDINQQACTGIQGKLLRTNEAAVLLGLTWRPTATGWIQPYLRGVAGPAYLGGSFVEASASVVAPTDTTQSPYRIRTLLGDPNQRTITWLATLAGGVTLTISPGAQLRFEARDVMTDIPVATGPGGALVPGSPAQVGGKVFHLPSFTVGLDIVLEQSQRPRRY